MASPSREFIEQKKPRVFYSLLKSNGANSSRFRQNAAAFSALTALAPAHIVPEISIQYLRISQKSALNLGFNLF